MNAIPYGPDDAVAVVYASHLLEHRRGTDTVQSQTHSREPLSPNGVRRVVVHDARAMVGLCGGAGVCVEATK